MREHPYTILEHDSKSHVREQLLYLPLDLDRIFFRHKLLSLAYLILKK